MKKKATITDIARALNITPSAVSKALNGHPRISKKTRDAVEAMAAKLNYRPNHLASGLRKGQSGLLGMLVPATEIKAYAAAINGAEAEAEAAGYNVIIAQSRDEYQKELKVFESMNRTQVEGLIVCMASTTTRFEHFDKWEKEGPPLVLFDRIFERGKRHMSVLDDYLASYVATEHLIEQGCTRLAHLSGPLHIPTYENRMRAFKDRLKRYGFEEKAEWMPTSALTIEDGRAFMEGCFERGEIPDGIFASSDYAAFGAMRVLQEKGLKVPEEVAMVGFGNEQFGAFIQPGLSTIDPESEAMGRLAARLLIQQIRMKSSEIPSYRRRILKPKLIVRESSRRNVHT
ncbi:MAG: LacI family DNA-binding transcriptional regulator [Bacteroidota bacterium]